MQELGMTHLPVSEPVAADAQSTELAQFGIISRQHTVYEWNGFRYSSASDAIAAAKRAGR
jgi:hypothetical protein